VIISLLAAVYVHILETEIEICTYIKKTIGVNSLMQSLLQRILFYLHCLLGHKHWDVNKDDTFCSSDFINKFTQ